MTDTTSPTDLAHFDLGYDALLPVFRDAVTSKGMKVAEHEGHSDVTLSRGVIRVSPDGSKTSVQLFEADAIGGQVLRDLLDEMAGKMGVALTWDAPRDRGRPANLSLTRVVQSAAVTPSFHRVTVTAPDLDRFGTGGLHFTLPQGPEGADWPYTDEGGVTRWPEGIAAWHRPVFTTRSIEMVEGVPQLTFDVYMHAGGLTPPWVHSLVPGDEVALMGPSGSAMPKPTAYLAVIADETAVPVAARILSESAPDVTGQVFLIVPTAEDIHDMAAPKGVTITWLTRDTGATPLSALDQLHVPDADRYVLFAAEKSEAAEAREKLTAMGLVRGEFLAASYWTAG